MRIVNRVNGPANELDREKFNPARFLVNHYNAIQTGVHCS